MGGGGGLEEETEREKPEGSRAGREFLPSSFQKTIDFVCPCVCACCGCRYSVVMVVYTESLQYSGPASSPPPFLPSSPPPPPLPQPPTPMRPPPPFASQRVWMAQSCKRRHTRGARHGQATLRKNRPKLSVGSGGREVMEIKRSQSPRRWLSWAGWT